MRQILCVVDSFESAAGGVLEVASMIARSSNAHLIVLYPYRLIINGFEGDIPSLRAKLEKEAKDKFAKLRETHLDGVASEFVAEIGFTADRIEANVKKKKIDMVVIGQQQATATNDVKTFNLQSLIADSRLPFVIVPAEVKLEPSV